MSQRSHASECSSSCLGTDNVSQLDVNFIYQIWQLNNNEILLHYSKNH